MVFSTVPVAQGPGAGTAGLLLPNGTNLICGVLWLTSVSPRSSCTSGCLTQFPWAGYCMVLLIAAEIPVARLFLLHDRATDPS